MIGVRDVRCQCKNYWRLWQRAIWSLWQIQRRVEFDFVAHRNLDAPTQLVVRRWLCGGWRRSWRLRDEVCCKERREHRNPKQSLHCRGIEDEACQRNKGSSWRQKSDAGTRRTPKAGPPLSRLARTELCDTIGNGSRPH